MYNNAVKGVTGPARPPVWHLSSDTFPITFYKFLSSHEKKRPVAVCGALFSVYSLYSLYFICSGVHPASTGVMRAAYSLALGRLWSL